MKTAMQELIDSYEKSANQYLEMKQINKASMYFNLAKWAKGLLEKEKEQIKKANLDGYIEGCKHFSFGTDPKPTEQYFNETYQNK